MPLSSDLRIRRWARLCRKSSKFVRSFGSASIFAFAAALEIPCHPKMLLPDRSGQNTC